MPKVKGKPQSGPQGKGQSEGEVKRKSKDKDKDKEKMKLKLKGKQQAAKSAQPEEEKAKAETKQKAKAKIKVRTKTVDYFPRGGMLPSTQGGQKKAAGEYDSDAEEFVFNKAPVQLVRKKRNKFELGVPKAGELKKKRKKDDDVEDAKIEAEARAEGESDDNLLLEAQTESHAFPRKPKPVEGSRMPKRTAKEEEGLDLTRIKRLVQMLIDRIESSTWLSCACGRP